ncbi:MAG: hypothetical protein V4612_02265 [Pseudomonadota bacterium]
MFSIVESLIILAILSLNFGVIIWLKNRIAVVSSVMLINLIIILLCAISIADYQILKELIIAITIYSITILTLISNTNHIDQISSNKPLIGGKFNRHLILIITLMISCSVFYLSQSIKQQSTYTATSQLEKIIGTNKEAPISAAKSEQKNLKNNVLFKRSTDAILIIVGVMAIMLLGSKYRGVESKI